MSEDQAAEMLPIFQAITDGENEVQALYGKDWVSLPNDPRFYRIKPREFWLVGLAGTNKPYSVWFNKPPDDTTDDIIHVQEIPL